VHKEDIRQGIYVRLLSAYVRLPAGILATVDRVGKLKNGDFFFTVRWLNPPAGTRSCPVSDRSLNLWVSDLEKFESVSKEETENILTADLPRQKKLPALLSVREPRQLGLFEDIQLTGGR
jgi:hypothetical protein